MPDPNQRLFSTHAAALYLGFARQTLSKWRVEGSGPRFIRVGGRVMYHRADLDAFIDEQPRRRSTADVPGADDANPYVAA